MELEEIHIGKMVEKAFNQSSLTKTAFADAIGILNQNLNREFQKSDWSVIKLIKAGKVLNYDFSSLFAVGERVTQSSKVLLQIEVKEEDVNEVLKIIENKSLYNLLKRT